MMNIHVDQIFILIVKTFVIISLFLYFLFGISMARQIWLMNRAIRTKLAGCLNLVALIHVGLILIGLVLVVLA